MESFGANMCQCGKNGYSGKCGLCIIQELEQTHTPRTIKNPTKDGKCNCLIDPVNGFKYTAHEVIDGKIVDVQYIKCDNTKLKLIDISKVKKEKRNTLRIVEVTSISKFVWVEWCKSQCKGKCKKL